MKLRVSSEERRIEILWSVQTPSLHAVANGHSGEGIFENFTPKLQLPAVHIATSELCTLQSNRKKKKSILQVKSSSSHILHSNNHAGHIHLHVILTQIKYKLTSMRDFRFIACPGSVHFSLYFICMNFHLLEPRWFSLLINVLQHFSSTLLNVRQ